MSWGSKESGKVKTYKNWEGGVGPREMHLVC